MGAQHVSHNRQISPLIMGTWKALQPLANSLGRRFWALFASANCNCLHEIRLFGQWLCALSLSIQLEQTIETGFLNARDPTTLPLPVTNPPADQEWTQVKEYVWISGLHRQAFDSLSHSRHFVLENFSIPVQDPIFIIVYSLLQNSTYTCAYEPLGWNLSSTDSINYNAQSPTNNLRKFATDGVVVWFSLRRSPPQNTLLPIVRLNDVCYQHEGGGSEPCRNPLLTFRRKISC